MNSAAELDIQGTNFIDEGIKSLKSENLIRIKNWLFSIVVSLQKWPQYKT